MRERRSPVINILASPRAGWGRAGARAGTATRKGPCSRAAAGAPAPLPRGQQGGRAAQALTQGGAPPQPPQPPPPPPPLAQVGARQEGD